MLPTPLVPDLYALDLGGVNAYLIAADDGLTLIDTGSAGSAERLARALDALGYALADISRNVVTHAHALTRLTTPLAQRTQLQ